MYDFTEYKMLLVACTMFEQSLSDLSTEFVLLYQYFSRPSAHILYSSAPI